MATFTTNTNNTYYAILTCTETGISGNASKIAYSLTLYSGNSAFDGYTIGYDIYINGSRVAYHDNSGNQTAMSKYSSKLVVSGTTNAISHNSDGTKSVDVSVRIWTDNVYYLPVSLAASGSMPLTDTAFPVTYNANGGTNAPADGMKYYNTTYTITSGVPTRDGYNFLGWSTSDTATSPLYRPGSSYTSNAPLNLYAVWEVANGKSTVSLSTTSANLGDDIVIYIRTLDSTNLHKVEWTSGNNTYLSHGEATANITATLMEDQFVGWFGSNDKVIDVTITVTTRTRSGSELGSSSVVFSLCMPDVLGKPSEPIATLSNKTPTGTVINLTKPTDFKYGSTFREWVVASNIGVIDIVGDTITITKDEGLNKTGVATIQAMDSRGFLSDPLDIVWHNRRKGVCVFEDGMWNPIVLHAYIDGAWDDNIYASVYVDEQCLISSDNNLLLSSDNYRLKGDDKWQIIH